MRNNDRTTARGTLVAAAITVIVMLTACATSKKTATDDSAATTAQTDGSEVVRARQLAFVQKVYDNAVYVKNISSKIDLTLGSGSDALSVAGTLKMRRDEVIRIQVTPLGLMEVGRLEFTPDSVLIVDRMNKEYARAAYDEVPFLTANDIDFYMLQSLFWNELFLPGEQVLKESDLKRFDVDLDGGSLLPVTYGQDKLSYRWSAEAATGRIDSTDITYTGSDSDTAALHCVYGSFVPVGSKQFPTETALTFASGKTAKAGSLGMTLRLKAVDTSADWEATTTVGSKYRRVTAADILKKLIGVGADSGRAR